MHPSGRYFSIARQTNLRSGCCLLAVQGSVWAVIQTVWRSNQSVSTGKPYRIAEAPGHRANTSPRAKSGLVKNWCISICLVDVSHLQPRPRSSAPSVGIRAWGHSMKLLRNKDDIFWEAPGLYVPGGVCKLKGIPSAYPLGREPRCSTGNSRGNVLLLRNGPAASPTTCEQAEVWQTQPLHLPFPLLFAFPSGPSALLSFNSKIHLAFKNCIQVSPASSLKWWRSSEMLQCWAGQGTSCTYTQLSCVHFPWPLHMSMQPSPM